MKHYDYQDRFKELYDKSVQRFRAGETDASKWFDEDEQAFIAANGWRLQDFFDYAEDNVGPGEPSYEIAQSIEQVRRDYFLHMQNGVPSANKLSPDELPPKPAALDGIEWLPRIIAKAKGKITGELCDDIMYSCGGDRKFLKTHDIHPAEFLRVVWANMENDQGIIDFVKKRSSAVPA